MSREQWYSGVGTKGNSADVLPISAKYSDKTSDPDAKDYDEALEIFLNGVKLARGGDLDAAAPQIACAFLLHGRSINYALVLPTGVDASTKNSTLDYEVLTKLIEHDEHSVSSSVLRVVLANWLGSQPQFGQGLIAAGLVHIDLLIKKIEIHPEIEEPGSMILGGCLTRKALLRHKSALHMAMGNHRMAVKDLTQALEIDEFYTPARDARACVWAALKLKGHKRIHEEFKRCIAENHEDYRGNEVHYAWLALTILSDPSLGSNEDARGYYDKCVRASSRRDEIYGRRPINEMPDAVKLVRARFQSSQSLPTISRQLENVSLGVASNKLKRSCLKCAKKADANGGKLSQCARCKVAYYCSRTCQVDDWPNHKKFCKIMKAESSRTSDRELTLTSSFGRVDESPNNDMDSNIAKEKLGEWASNILAAKRFQAELAEQFQKLGKGFSEWWSEMDFNKKKNTLLDVTYSSIPLQMPSDQEITRLLDQSRMSSALFEYNVETLCGTCECSENCSHHKNERLIHEMADWSYRAEQKENENLFLCVEKRRLAIFPDMFGGRLAFVPVTNDEIFEASPCVFNDDAPFEEVQRFKGYMERGLAHDASAVQYAMSRKMFSLALMVKLFDVYHEKIRRTPPKNPLERLQGCGHCRGSCQGVSSKQCTICKTSWFCCRGCMVAANHSRCPLMQAQESKALFT